MLKIIIICLLIIVILICSFHGLYKTDNENNNDNNNNDTNNRNYPCNEILTDDEYLEHMITHHEVAVDMSKTHLQHTTNPLIIDILIDVIRVQTFQIHLMEESQTELNIKSNKNTNIRSSPNAYRYTQGDFTKPNIQHISDTYCDPSFFDASHSKNLHKMTDIMYIEHMIPHHQVAIDMSKRILESTNNNFIIDLAYKIIYSQQLEIFKLSELLKSKNMFESTIL